MQRERQRCCRRSRESGRRQKEKTKRQRVRETERGRKM
jgi:hypothetical protein